MTNFLRRITTALEHMGQMQIDEEGRILCEVSGLPSALVPMGPWDASTGVYPTDPNVGEFWWVSVAGTIEGTAYDINDWLVYVDTGTWAKVDNTQNIHALGGTLHSASTLAELNALISDATLMDGGDITEPKQSSGYYVSIDRGTTALLGADGSLFNPFEDPNEAISLGVANGDSEIVLYLDMRLPLGYTVNVPAGKNITIVGGGSLTTKAGWVDVVLSDGCDVSVDNVYAYQIWEDAGITDATIYFENCYVYEIKGPGGVGYATKTNGIFSNTLIDDPATTLVDVQNINKAIGTVFHEKVGADRIYVLNEFNMNGKKLSNLPLGVDIDDAAALDQVPLSGIIPAASFTGNPRKATVVFSTPMPNLAFAPMVIGEADTRNWSFESRSVNGFVINTNTAAPLANAVNWTATRWR